MVNKVMWPWTRSGLRAAAKEILEADKMILTEYRSQKIIEDNKLLLNMMNGPSKTLLINTLKEKPCKISDVTVKTINDIVRGVKKGELLLSPDIAYDVLNFDKENRKSLNQKPGWFAKKLDPKAIEEINKTPPFNLIEHTKLKAELDDSIKKDIAKNKPQQEKEKQPKFVEARIANLAWMFGMSKEQVVDKIAYASGKVAGLGAGMGTFYALDNKTFSAAITGISATYAALPIAVSAVVWGGAVAGVGAAGYVLYKGAQAVVNLVLQGKEELPTMQQITAENVSLVEMNKFIKAKQEVHEKEASKKESKLQDIKQLDINMDFSFMQPARQTKESDIRYIYTISGEKFGEKVTQDELSQAFKKVAGIHEESSDSTKITYTAKIR